MATPLILRRAGLLKLNILSAFICIALITAGQLHTDAADLEKSFRSSYKVGRPRYEVLGLLLEKGKISLADATTVTDVLIRKTDNPGPAKDQLLLAVYDTRNVLITQQKYPLTGHALIKGVQNIPLNKALNFANAAYIKVWIENSRGEPVSSGGERIIRGSYKGLPLASDWITNTGLGIGANILNPLTVPAGVDPVLVNTKQSAVSYRYTESYPALGTNNLLWYKTGAYDAKSTIYDRDGTDWEQKALPIGNGYMGGMLFGMPGKDHIQFNEETFWAAGYRGVQKSVDPNFVNPEMSEGINGFMNAGNIFIDFNLPENPLITDYYRDLNLDEAVAHVQYSYNNVKYSREYFASYPAKVLVFRYTADKTAALNFTVNPVSAHPGNITVNNGEITITGNLKDSEPYRGGGRAAYSQKSDLEYCTKIRVMADDGQVLDNYGRVAVKGATGVTIIVTAATDYDPNQFVIGADGKVDIAARQFKSLKGIRYAIDKATARMAGIKGKSYQRLKTEHIADYQRLFNRVAFSLTGDIPDKVPTDELQTSYNKVIPLLKAGEAISFDPSAYKMLNKHLEELHFNYARYLMIASSRETTLPSTLQGKWNQSVAEIWGSSYCININLQMNYWFAGGASLPESGKALLNWFTSQIPAGRITAKNMYKIEPRCYTLSGHTLNFSDKPAGDQDDVFIMHTKQSINGQTDMTGSRSIQSPGNTAFMMYNLWDLYRTGGDQKLLASTIYPIMRKAANFYTQALYANRKSSTDLKRYPNGYYYTTGSGRSPEQGPTQEGVKYDLQLVAGMFDYTIEAAGILGVDADKVAAWKEIRSNLETPVELGADKQIKEWPQETAYNTDAAGKAMGDPFHRHISHLVGLYPGTLISPNTPDLLAGARITLQKRGDDATGWSIANKFLMWARVLDGDKALQLFRYQLAQRTYSNLFDFHAPFQIDGNFGSAAGVMELLMQSQTGTIYILPALPVVWDKGSISGMKAKTGATVSIKWSANKADEVVITPAKTGEVKIGYKLSNTLTVNSGNKTTIVTGSNGIFTIAGVKDKPIKIGFN